MPFRQVGKSAVFNSFVCLFFSSFAAYRAVPSGSTAVLRGRDCTASFYRTQARRRQLSKLEPDRELRGRLAKPYSSLFPGLKAWQACRALGYRLRQQPKVPQCEQVQLSRTRATGTTSTLRYVQNSSNREDFRNRQHLLNREDFRNRQHLLNRRVFPGVPQRSSRASAFQPGLSAPVGPQRVSRTSARQSDHATEGGPSAANSYQSGRRQGHRQARRAARSS